MTLLTLTFLESRRLESRFLISQTMIKADISTELENFDWYYNTVDKSGSEVSEAKVAKAIGVLMMHWQ